MHVSIFYDVIVGTRSKVYSLPSSGKDIVWNITEDVIESVTTKRDVLLRCSLTYQLAHDVDSCIIMEIDCSAWGKCEGSFRINFYAAINDQSPA